MYLAFSRYYASEYFHLAKTMIQNTKPLLNQSKIMKTYGKLGYLGVIWGFTVVSAENGG